MQGDERLKQLAKQFMDDYAGGAKPDPERVTVREFLRWFGYEKRGQYIVSEIRNKMEELKLHTVPDFRSGSIDSEVTIEPVPGSLGAESSGRLEDPTVRIGDLAAAKRKPTTVAPDASLSTATTLMLLNDYSQLPVMTGERTVKGVISWQSMGVREALGRECKFVRDCMGSAKEIGIKAPLFEAVREISEHGYVLVRGEAEEITGIVTASDVVDQFEQLAARSCWSGRLRNIYGSLCTESSRSKS